MSDIPAGFVRPFSYDGICFIWDGNGKMAADFPDDGDVVRPRGWGRIHSNHLREGGTMEEAGEIMDRWEAWLSERVGETTDPEEVIRLLNEVNDG